MSDSQSAQFLICYDIADPKRLNRVHRYLKNQGLPIQYSVFTVELRRKPLERLMETLKGIIDQREDDVRCYTLPNSLDFEVIGQQVFPEGVMLFSASGVSRLMSK